MMRFFRTGNVLAQRGREEDHPLLGRRDRGRLLLREPRELLGELLELRLRAGEEVAPVVVRFEEGVRVAPGQRAAAAPGLVPRRASRGCDSSAGVVRR